MLAIAIAWSGACAGGRVEPALPPPPASAATTSGPTSSPPASPNSLWGDAIRAALGDGGLPDAGEGGSGIGEGCCVDAEPVANAERPPSRSGIRIRQRKISVVGRLPTDVVQRIVRHNFGRFRVCYEEGLNRNEHLDGQITATFDIDRAGSPGNVAIRASDSTLHDPKVVACVLGALGKLAFPQPEGGTVSVVYPLLFSLDP